MPERAALASPTPGGTGLNDPDLLLGVRFPLDPKNCARVTLYALQFPQHRFEVHGKFLCLMDDSKNTTTGKA